MDGAATTVVSVFMNETGDVYAQRPRFEQALYRFELVENQPPQQFAQVEAHHRAVELGKDRVWYTLNRERDAAGFRIDPETGWLRSLEPFDAEAKKFYSLKVGSSINACLESNTKWCAHAEAIIVIRDENDNAPKFTQPSYNLTIPPDLSAGTDLLQIRAEDADSGLNGEVRYAISSSSASEVARLFKINERTGELRLENSLPADRPHLAVYISAHDLGEPPMESIAEVRIAVSADAQFTNQHAPEFDDFRYEFSKKVPIPIGAIVARVHASDPDEGADGRVWYKFAEDTPLTRKFLIDKKSGEIRVISPISRENGDLIQLVVEAHDQSGDFPRKSETVVLLHLLDDETEPLEFLPLPKTVYISTAKPLGSAIFKVGLKNTNVADVKFSVEQDLRNELFAVIDDLLVVQAKLKPGAYRITIRATATTPAKGQTSVESHSLRMIVMTDREKYPVFEKLSYELKIAPNAEFPVKLPAFNATVKEGRIGYSIYNADGKEAVRGIKIDEITGQLTVFEEFVQQITDDLPRGTVFVVVRATNLDHPTFFSDVGVRLGLKTSGRELAFTSRLYRLITKENAPVGSTINTVRIGIQDPALFAGAKYSIEPSEWFDIRENGSVVVKKPIDLESLPAEWKGVVEATVTAHYFGQEAKSHVQIKVEDVDEFEPVFEQPSYSFDVDPELPSGEWIGSVHAVDGDFSDRAGLTYRGLGNALGIVNITNAGRLIKNEGKEFVPGQNYSLIVQAGPIGGRTVGLRVEARVVNRFVLVGSGRLLQREAKRRNDIAHHSTANHSTDHSLDYSLDFLFFQLLLHQPTLSPADMLASKLPSKWTPEQPDEKILLPSMPDRSDWDFRIADGNSDGRITVEKVNKTTAQLGLRTEMLGTRPDKPADLIVLEITNLDDPFERHQANLSVDLQKVVVRPLAFGTARTDLRVELSAADPTKPFGRVDVQCPAADCRFELTENPLGLFAIDAKTGDLFLQKLPPDVPLGDHEVLVSVRSGKQTIQRVFTINVRDESGGQAGGNAVDESDGEGPKEQPTAKPLASATPTRPTTAAPNSPPSSSAAISSTTPHGLEMLTSLQEEAQETTFEITSEVTTPSTTHPKLIEPLLETLGPSEEPPIPTIPTIKPQVEESGESTTILGTQINVQSTEAPPSPPPVDSKPKFRFEQAAYRFEVSEPKHHVEIGRLNVVGAAKAKMRITPDQYRQWFGIDPNTNMLYIREVPAELHGRQRAEFTVIAQDAQNSKARAETTVSVDLLLPDEDGEVRETLSTTTTSFASTTTTTTVRPSSAKTTQSPANALSSLLSSLSSAVTPTAAFSSDQTTEETAIFSTVDLSPTVVPSAPPAQPQAHGFRFKHPLYTAMLPERQYGNRGTVVNVHPAPLREGLENVVFSIVTNEPALPFHVRNSTGELIVFDNVDREATNEYRFNISATKLDNPKELTTTEVKVTILDVNDNYPLFVSPPYVVPIDASARPGVSLATFKAVDPDEGPNGRITYRIVENFENLFDINGKGELSLTTQLPALSTDLFNITISAIDGGRPALRTQHQVQIQVFPDASEQPAFKKTEYTVEVPRGSDVGAFVAQIVAGSIPLDYVLLEDSNGLFGIDERGIVELRRKPTIDEQNRYHSLTAVAESKSGKTANTTVHSFYSMTLNVFVEGDPIVVTVTPASLQPAQSTPAAPRCTFKSKLYNAEVRENTPGRSKLTTVDTNCKEAVRFVAAQISKEFELNEQTGEVFVLEALDREKKSLHFIVVNLTLAAESGASKQRRQANHPIAEYTKNKLAANQALVVIKVLDENDNPPVLARLTADQQFVFSVDWQAPLLQPVARIQAFDPDEQPQLSFELSENDFFAINATTGVVSVVRSLLNVDEEQFDLEVRVADGKHKAAAPLKIYKLAPGLNIAILTVDAPEADVDEVQAARKLSGLLERDVHVLTKQVFISEDGHADPQRTHLFVYALDRNTKIPLDGITLKMLLDQHNASLKDEELPVSGISLPSVSSTLRLTPTEIVLMAVCCCLMVLACCMFFLLLRCCKRRTIVAQPDMKYMVGSVEANPRPYNVELISRKTAQNVLSGRPLPDPYEETTMTPKSRASMVTASGVYAADGSQRTVSSTVTDEMPNQPRPAAEPPVIQIVHPISAKPHDE
ncbi:Cadherin domain containing protein [Aphelenchoides fujianensis]|nr:Cadherin domain containing protein [Aphelenchoides fujianensis]